MMFRKAEPLSAALQNELNTEYIPPLDNDFEVIDSDLIRIKRNQHHKYCCRVKAKHSFPNADEEKLNDHRIAFGVTCSQALLAP